MKKPELVKARAARGVTEYCAKCGKELRVQVVGFEPETVFWYRRSDPGTLFCTRKCGEQANRAPQSLEEAFKL